MTELLTAAQMRAIEAAAIASGEVTGLELMERAGRGVVEAIFEEWPELNCGGGAAPVPPGYLGQDEAGGRRAVVLCGPGNNGGDGFVVARLLKERGWAVEVFLYGEPERMPPDARVNYERWVGMGEVSLLSSDDTQEKCGGDFSLMRKADVVVDALFGTGLSRCAPFLEPVSYILHRCFRDALWWHGEQSTPRWVAVDLPSGICSDSGRELTDEEGNVLGEPYAAYLTVTFHRAKQGHFLAEGPLFSTRLRVVDIGLKDLPWNVETFLQFVQCVDAPETLATMASEAALSKKAWSHKYENGHALILSGPPGRGGAARLSARGALRIGAGLVTLGCPPDAIPENAARVDAVMLRAVADAAGLGHVLGDGRINAVCLGPGLGTGDAARALVAGVLGVGGAVREDRAPYVASAEGVGVEPRPTVLDADALTILSRDPALFAALHDRCVLTPHAGEFARLFPDIAAKLDAPATKGPAYSKVDACREAAARAGCVVLFKGADTVIADPSGRCSVNSAHYERAAPWLATAGSGDVLAGFITGLLARGFPPMQAAETAAWLHVECALSFGPGLIAEDIPEELPKVFRSLGL